MSALEWYLLGVVLITTECLVDDVEDLGRALMWGLFWPPLALILGVCVAGFMLGVVCWVWVAAWRRALGRKGPGQW